MKVSLKICNQEGAFHFCTYTWEPKLITLFMKRKVEERLGDQTGW